MTIYIMNRIFLIAFNSVFAVKNIYEVKSNDNST